MLNELLIIERGAHQAGLKLIQRHPDIKDAGKKPTLRVRLGASGEVVGIDPVPRETPLWTFGRGNKLRFPFVQPPVPLLRRATASDDLTILTKLRGHQWRDCLLKLCRASDFNDSVLAHWPGIRGKNGRWTQRPEQYLDALRARAEQLQGLVSTDGESVLAVIDRFVAACGATDNCGVDLLRRVVERLINVLEQSPTDDWLSLAESLLLRGGAALYFDVPTEEFARSAGDPRQVAAVTQALEATCSPDADQGICSLSGEPTVLVKDTFPELVLPIGKTILFSRFDAIPSNGRYGRFGADSFAVAQQVADRLAAGLRCLTVREKAGITWRMIPREATKKRDLLLAFVEEVPDAPAAGALADDEGDLSEESPHTGLQDDSVAAFEKRTQRLVGAVRARVSADFRNTPVRLIVFRKVDPANTKAVYAGVPTVGELYNAAMGWVAGEQNVPPWLTLPVLRKGETKPRPMSPPHVAPLGVIAFSKAFFIRGGKQRKEVLGFPAAEALDLFLDRVGKSGDPTWQRITRLMHLVLARRSTIVSSTAHAMRRGFDFAKEFDRREVLRTITLLGVLLHKLGRSKENYMNDVAFKLGQLLAAADVVHAGYCADVRGGDVPPSLLGNQVFTIAQTAPTKALAMLCRRWKPYDGWAKKADRERRRTDTLIASKKPSEKQRERDIKEALRCAREMRPLADALAPALDGCAVDDTFRAELLLGYIAGLPKAQRDDRNNGDTATQVAEMEE